MLDILYNDAIQVLLQRIPEFNYNYTLALREWLPEEMPAHIVYGSVFANFIETLEKNWRKTNDKDLEDVLLRSFLLIENLASSSDFETSAQSCLCIRMSYSCRLCEDGTSQGGLVPCVRNTSCD